MAIIYSYPSVTPVVADILLITQANDPSKATKSVTLSSVKTLFGLNDSLSCVGTTGYIPFFQTDSRLIDSVISQTTEKSINIGTVPVKGGGTASNPYWIDNFQVQGTLSASGNVAIGTPRELENQGFDLNVLGEEGKIAFGDNNVFGDPATGTPITWNVVVGEYGTGDTDVLQLHGKSGTKFTRGALGSTVSMSIDSSGNVEIENNLTVDSNATFGEDDSTEVNIESTLNLKGPIKDSAGILGGNEQLLISNASGQVSWGDASTIIGVGVTGEITAWTSATTLGTAPIKLGAGVNSLMLNDITQSTASGTYSTAMGNFTTASGGNSTAMGRNTTASGYTSTAIGYNSIASGESSFAGGGSSLLTTPRSGGIAYGSNSFAFGSDSIAGEVSGNSGGAIAIGVGCEAEGSNSVAIGNNSKATRSNSFAAGVGNLASGVSSTALGSVTVSSGNNSFACGDNTTASGDISFAAGKGTVASGDGSIAMGGIGTGTSTAAGEASAVFGGLQNTANGTNSTILGGQKNTIDAGSGDSGIIGGEDNNVTAGSRNSILLGGIGLTGGGIHQTAVGVANVSRNDAKFIVGVGSYNGPASITRENGFVVTDSGEIQLDQYASNFLSNNYQFPVLNIDQSGRVKKGNLADMLPDVPPEMSKSAFTFQDGSNQNLFSTVKGIVIASWTGVSGSATATLPQSSSNLNKLITIVTSASFGSAGGSNILGIKPGFGDTINDTAAPNNIIELDKAYESAEFYATSDGWIMLRKTII
jgi:hypothetical protein